MSIRSHLLVLVLSVLVPAVFAAAWVIATTYGAEREALERNLRDTTRALSLVIDRELAQRALVARMLARSHTLDADGPPTPSQLAAFEGHAKAAMAGLQGWAELVSADQVLVDTRQAPGSAQRRRDHPGLLQEAPTVGNLVGGEPGTPLHAPIVEPVFQNERATLNVRLMLLPEELQRIVDRQALPEGWVAAVIDGAGRVVARRPAQERHVGGSATPELLHLMAQRREGLVQTTSLDGSAVTGYFSTTPQGWTYATAMPRSGVGPRLPEAVQQLVLGTGLLLAAAVSAALVVARRIVAPVNALRLAADDMRAGRAVHLPPTGIRECDAVGGALVEAARTMQDSQSELQRQVAEAAAQARAAEQHVSRSQRAEALGRLTGGVAHDFNNLLGVIGNSAHLMQRHATDVQLKVPLAAVLRSVEAGSRLTQHLLRVAGRHPARPASVDLARELPELRELLRVVLGQRIPVEVRVEPGTWPVTVDTGELELALINLALNARDALPRGGHVWIDARNTEPGDAPELPRGHYVTLSFSDDGRGIDEETALRAFEPFFTTKPVGQGTGLGLSQVQGFATQAGGRARLASTPGLGTSVTLLLPAASHPPAALPPGAPAASDAGIDPRLNGRRVLLVEDNDELASVTAALLSATGCRVDTVPGAAQAVERLAGGTHFDVVLSDVVMPGDMDGVSLAQHLQQRQPPVPVVLISGYSSALAGTHGLRVLRKPCTPQQLSDALAAAIAGR